VNHSGTFRCWCWQLPPPESTVAVVPSVPNRRNYVGGKTSVRVKCGCRWAMSFYRRNNGKKDYCITTRILIHNDHEVADPHRLETTVDSLRHVSSELRQAVEDMVKCGMAVSEAERRFFMATHKVTIDKDVFRNLVYRVRTDLGMYDSESDFARLLEWLQVEMRNHSAVARYHVESGHVIDGVFYMSADMVYNFGRNGVSVVMDTTFKTNRFGWPLLIVCGVNEHGQTVIFAVAVLHHQTTEAFMWVLECMREAVTTDDWNSTSTCLTDGDQAMSAALISVSPHVQHVRCIFHLELNIRDKLRELGVPMIEIELFITQWKSVVNEEDVEDFDSGKRLLANRCPLAQLYFTDNHWTNETLFALCFVKHYTTLGQRSTQRVEGLNGVLKGMLQVRSSTALQSLFQTLQFASSEADRQAVANAAMHAARHPKPVNARTVEGDVHPHLTFYALTKVKQQFDVSHNYHVAQLTVAGTASTWTVWDRQSAVVSPGRVEKRREVQARDDFMRCSCCWPTMHQLPCRHVIALNLHLFNQPFMVGQVGKRWLRAHRPRPETYPTIEDLHARAQSESDSKSAVPSSLISSTVPAPVFSSRGRAGQVLGYSQNLAARVGEYQEIFPTIISHVRALSHWADAQTAAIESGRSKELLPLPLPTGPSGMHPTIEPGDVQFPKRRRGKPGTPSESRKKSRGEKGGSGISATQD
jgi:hypothetical protein